MHCIAHIEFPLPHSDLSGAWILQCDQKKHGWHPLHVPLPCMGPYVTAEKIVKKSVRRILFTAKWLLSLTPTRADPGSEITRRRHARICEHAPKAKLTPAHAVPKCAFRVHIFFFFKAIKSLQTKPPSPIFFMGWLKITTPKNTPGMD